jgi:hypothetical protein
MRSAAPAVLAALALLLPACGSGKPAARGADGAPRTAADSAAADLMILGSEISRLLDLAADYRGSHHGAAPRTLRTLGIDSLTPALARSIRASGRDAWVTVTFRRPEGRQWTSCTGDLEVLESAVLGTGGYTLSCRTPAGEVRTVQAGGTLE